MIEIVDENNIAELLPLMRAYQQFYQVADISDDKNQAFFSAFAGGNSEGCLFLYRDDDGSAIGFATVYFTYSSSLTAKVAVLNDVFTVEPFRGQGVARALIEHCKQFALDNGAARLQWLTAQDNTQAQKLYDALDTKRSAWFFYSYS